MSSTSLRILVVIDAVVIVILAAVAWLGEYLPLAMFIAIVAAMLLQVVAALRPVRRATGAGTSVNETSP